MEGLKKRVLILAGFFAIAGAVFLALPSAPKSVVDEQWMKDHAPDEVAGMKYARDAYDPEISYQMDKATYEMLKPFGIVARTYQDMGRQFDVVLVAGNDKENFHDPQVCFRAQGWTFSDTREIQIPTKTRGTIPASFSVMQNRGKEAVAVYFYRGPKGFYPSTPNLGLAMLMGPLMGDFKTDAVFYRFMPMHDGATQQDVIDFVAEYMDVAGQVSNGYF